MYYVLDENDAVIDMDPSPVGARLKAEALKRTGKYARIEYDEGACVGVRH